MIQNSIQNSQKLVIQSMFWQTEQERNKAFKNRFDHNLAQCRTNQNQGFPEIERVEDTRILMGQRQTNVNNMLEQLGMEKIYISSPSKEESFDILLQLIESLLVQITKLKQSQDSFRNERKKTDSHILQQWGLMEKMRKQQQTIHAQKQTLKLRSQNAERHWKQSFQKAIAEKQQYQKQVRRIQAREKAFEAEFRKKENQITSLQTALKKIQQKPCSKVHTFVVNQEFDNDNRSANCTSPQSQYGILALNRIEQTLKQLQSQNLELRSYLLKITTQINNVFEIWAIKFQAEGLLLGQIAITGTKKQLFFMPTKQKSKHIESTLLSIKKLQQMSRLLNFNPETGKNDKIQNILQTDRLRSVLDSYNQIIKSQSQALNKWMLKADNFIECPLRKSEEERYEVLLQNQDLEKIGEIISRSLQFMQEKNKDLQATKRKVSNNLNQVYEIKSQLEKQLVCLAKIP